MTFTTNKTLKMELLRSLFSFVYCRVKLFVFAMNSIGDVIPFLCALFTDYEKRTQNQTLSLPFAVCRLLSEFLQYFYFGVSLDVTSFAQITVRHVGIPRAGVKFMPTSNSHG